MEPITERLKPQRVFDLGWKAFIIDDKLPSGLPLLLTKPELSCKYRFKNNYCIIGLSLTNDECQEANNHSLGFYLKSHKIDDPLIVDCLKTMQYQLHDNLAMWDTNNQKPMWKKNNLEREKIYREFAFGWGLTCPSN